MRNIFVSKPAILVAFALSLSSSVFAAPIVGSSQQRIELGKRRLSARQDLSTDQVTVQYDPNIIETDVGTIIESCQGTLVPNDDGTTLRHFKSCTYEVTPLGETPPPDDEVIGAPPDEETPPDEEAPPADETTETVAPPPEATDSPPPGEPELVTIGITTIGGASSAAPTDTTTATDATTTDAAATDSSAPPPAISAPGTVSFIPGTAIQAPNSSPTPTPTPDGTTVISTAQDGSVTTIVQQAEQQAAEVPGRKLEVLPIGLGVFAGISVIALIVVGLVTYERTKYRKAFRQRKMAETGASMGYGGMAEIR